MLSRLSLNNLVQLAVFLFGALCLTVPSGYSVGFFLLLALALPFVWRRSYWQELTPTTRMLLWVFLAFFAIQALSIWWDGGRLRELDRPSRLLMVALMLPLLCRYRPKFEVLMGGIGLGALLAGGIAIYQKLVLDIDRAFENHIMPIQGGDISMSLGLISLCGLAWAHHRGSRPWQLFLASATLLGIVGSLLSGSRGGWVLLPLVLLTCYLLFRHWFSRRFKLGLVVGLLGVLMVVMLPQSGVMNRIQQASSDVSQYVSGGNQDTSLGIRFQLWHSALLSFADKPVFGWGNNGIRESQQQQVEAGKLTQSTYDLKFHAHNQYLDELAKRGLVGLAALLALFLWPLAAAKQLLAEHSTAERHTLAAAVVIHILATMDYCLRQAFLGHNSGMVVYPLLLALLLLAAESKMPLREVAHTG